MSAGIIVVFPVVTLVGANRFAIASGYRQASKGPGSLGSVVVPKLVKPRKLSIK